jgi:hypothetical protein
LTGPARIEELARMLGGAEITARTREHASEMLAAARSPLPEVAPAARASRSGKGSPGARSARAGSANGR